MSTHIITQNVHHLTPEKEIELEERMGRRGIYAACLQETWMEGNKQWSTPDGYAFITHTHATEYKGRGVAIVLSPTAQRAWERAGQPMISRLGDRILSVRLQPSTRRRCEHRITLVSAYAPHSGRSHSEREAFQLDLPHARLETSWQLAAMQTRPSGRARPTLATIGSAALTA